MSQSRQDLPFATLPRDCSEGLTETRTRLGVFVLNVHYKANPAFRSESVIRGMKQGKDKKTFSREYELDWSSVEGQPVFPEFDPSRHVAKTRLSPQPGSLLVVGIDPGLSPGAAFTQKTVFGQVQLFRTLQPQQVSALQFGSELLANIYTEAQLRTLFPPEFLESWPIPMRFSDVWPEKLLRSVTPLCEMAGELLAVKYVGDPAGMQRNATAGKDSYFGMLKRLYKTVISKSTNSWPLRVASLGSLLLEGANTPDGDPLFIISGGDEGRQDTEFVRDGLAGSYAYPLNQEQEQPPKGPHSHPVDALQYAVMEHYPQGAGKVYGAALTTNYAALTGHPQSASSGSEHPAAPQATVGTVTPSLSDDGGITPLVTVGENGLLTFNKPWSPFLDSFA